MKTITHHVNLTVLKIKCHIPQTVMTPASFYSIYFSYLLLAKPSSFIRGQWKLFLSFFFLAMCLFFCTCFNQYPIAFIFNFHQSYPSSAFSSCVLSNFKAYFLSFLFLIPLLPLPSVFTFALALSFNSLRDTISFLLYMWWSLWHTYQFIDIKQYSFYFKPVVHFVADIYSLWKCYSRHSSQVSLSSSDKIVFHISCFEEQWLLLWCMDAWQSPGTGKHKHRQGIFFSIYWLLALCRTRFVFLWSGFMFFHPCPFFATAINLDFQLHGQ